MLELYFLRILYYSAFEFNWINIVYGIGNGYSTRLKFFLGINFVDWESQFIVLKYFNLIIEGGFNIFCYECSFVIEVFVIKMSWYGMNIEIKIPE